MGDKVLMIAYHFPPSDEVSGALRTLAMVRYLKELGVETIVMAPHPRAYPKTNQSTLDMVPAGCEVERAFALDVRRHLGFHGRYPLWLAQPDRWSSWWLGAVRQGMRLIRRHRPRVIWSTYPIATAHLIAASLHRRTGVPWIADFRDPIMPPVGQETGLTARSRAWVERQTIQDASACVFVTQGARRLYEDRYAEIRHGLFEVIPNGFDEEAFVGAVGQRSHPKTPDAPLRLVHSGVLYPRGRNPEAFMKALSFLLGSGRISVNDAQVVLRASGSEDYYEDMVRRYGLGGIVELAPAVSRAAALEEQFDADGLLLFQGREFNSQVPAKVYEYFRVGKPVLGLVDEEGETARLIRSEGVGLTADIESSEGIAETLLKFIGGLKKGGFKALDGPELAKYSRREGARQLLKVINRVSSHKRTGEG